MANIWIQGAILACLATAAIAGRAFPQETENFVQDLFRQINPQIEWDPTNFLIDLSGRYALCRSSRRRGKVEIEGWRMEDGASIGGLTDYTPGQLSHVGAVHEYLKNALPVWLDASPYKDQIKAATKFGCSVQPRCKGFVIFTCLFSPKYGEAPTPAPDVNECARANGGCDHICHNIPGSYYCSCYQGYTLQPDRHSCATSDVDECRVNNGGCDHICTNTQNSFYCSCRRGFTLMPDRRTCTENDIDECRTNNGGCDHFCTNTPNSFYCSCRSGYTLMADRRTCAAVEIDECRTNNGGCEHICTKTPDSFYCRCRDGFTLNPDRRTCQANDIDECRFNNGGCDHICTNTANSFYCSCRDNYYLRTDRRTCAAEDTDECAIDNGGCDHICTNTPNSYYCSCRSGFELQPDRKTCRQQSNNECARNNGGCSHICQDTPTSFYCLCRTGYTLAPDRRTCKDIDECANNNGGCDHNCVNTPGSFYCTCRRDFVLQSDGRTCLAAPTPPNLTDEQKALAFTRVEYDLAAGVTGTKWDQSHFLENLSGYETDCDMVGKSTWPWTYAKYEAKKWNYDVDGMFGVVPHLGSTSDSIVEILKSWAHIPTKEVGCSVIPDCYDGGQQYVVVGCIFRKPN